jgi:S-adenosylmethionine:tRNA ribosyltransferase-isomerase
MTPSDYDFELPPELIAQQPLTERTASRLLQVAADGQCHDRVFNDLPDLLRPGDLLIANDSRVLPARLYGRKATGGKFELFLERVLDEYAALVQIKASHPPLAGAELHFDDGIDAVMRERRGAFFVVQFNRPVLEVLDGQGHVPLPPYIRREDTPADGERYQTVYASERGSVAAPTAGLHFDQALLARLAARDIAFATVTLHVGAGTFAPLRTDQLKTGRLHAERVVVGREVCEAVGACRARNGRVIAVGTTATRALETAGESEHLRPFDGETTLFIRPGYSFRVVDALVTNFHLPRSSLLMLVAAFGGRERVLAAYRHAVAACYRFYSYGDAMLVERA